MWENIYSTGILLSLKYTKATAGPVFLNPGFFKKRQISHLQAVFS